jgi:hypothetical protein
MVQRSELTPGTIALCRDGRIAIVTELKPRNTKYPVIYKFKTGTNGYKGNENDFTAILGQGDLGAFNGKDEQKPRVSTGYDHDALVPDVLKGIKIGDTITIRSRRGTQQAEYLGYNPSRPKNCVSLRMNGKEYKGPLGIVVGKATPAAPARKRSEKEIMDDIRNVYCGLSPENLTCDGELPARDVRIKERRLERELKDLFKELGREVDEIEAYGLA